MLPPVGARFHTSVDYQGPNPQAIARQTLDTANSNLASGAAAGASPLSGSRLDILSLSGQLHLAQGLSVFAETIGKVLKISRREGETLADYATRLSEAIKTLKPEERANLQRYLNQIVKDLSLNLLARILDNPAGPEAARLTVRMETAQYLDRDLAARAVVSSYRQNAGEPLATAPRPTITAQSSQTAQEPSGTAPGSSREAQPVAAQTNPDAASEKNALPLPPTGQAAAPHISSQIVNQTANQASPLTEGPSGAMAEEDVPDNLPPALTRNAGKETAAPDGAAKPSMPAPDAFAAGGKRSEGVQPRLPDTQPPSSAQAGATGRPSPAISAELYDAPALARMAQGAGDADQAAQPQRILQTVDKPALQVALNGWLAKVIPGEELTAGTMAGTRPPSGTVAGGQPLPGGDPDTDPSQSATRPPAGPDAAPVKSSPANTETDPAPALAKPSDITATAERRPAPANGLLEPQTALQPGALAAMTAAIREALVPAYVAYPPAEEDPEAEERKARRVLPVDEDGEQQSSGHEAFGGRDGEPAQDDASEGADETSQENTEAEAKAQDYYLRMAGWS